MPCATSSTTSRPARSSTAESSSRTRRPRTARFTVYADAAFISGGQFVGYAGATRNELTGWVSVQHPVVTLAAGASVTDMITINVPSGATRGEHYGVIWVQQAAKARTGSGSAVIEVSRVGVRIYLAVGRGGAPPSSFDITSITGHLTDAGRPIIVAHVNNTGGRAIDLNGTVRLADGPGNTSSGPFSARQTVTLAPGQSWNVIFAAPKSLPQGSWRATVSLAERVGHGHGHDHHPAQRDRDRGGGLFANPLDLASAWRPGRRPRDRHVVHAAAPAPSSPGLTVSARPAWQFRQAGADRLGGSCRSGRAGQAGCRRSRPRRRATMAVSRPSASAARPAAVYVSTVPTG